MAAKTSAADGAGADAAGEALTLIVGPEQTRITVHRATLIAASPVFRDLITSCPDALGAGGVPLPEDDADAWALLAGLLQLLCPGLREITHTKAKGLLTLIDKYDMAPARALVDHELALRAPALFQGFNSIIFCNRFMKERIEAINLCHAHGLTEAEEAYTAQLLRQMRWESVLLKHALASTSGIESLALAKRLLQWLASGFR